MCVFQVKVNTSYFFEAMIDSDKWMRQEKFRKLGTSLSDMSLQERIEDAMSVNAYFRNGANHIGKLFLNIILFSKQVIIFYEFMQKNVVLYFETEKEKYKIYSGIYCFVISC